MSGAHRVPPWARVEIKLKMSFQALSHSPSHERAKALTSPPPDFLFSSIPLSNPKKILFQVVVEIAGDALVKVYALVAAHIVWFAGIHVEVGLRAGGDACL